jgi:hypothetical protein
MNITTKFVQIDLVVLEDHLMNIPTKLVPIGLVV